VPASVGPYLRSDAAAAYFAFSDAFQSRFGKALSITEAYRSYDRQVQLYNDYINGVGNLAATPGTSNHGWALACDFGSGVNTYGSAEKTWANANGPTFGWVPAGDGFVKPEAWHFEYNGTYTPEEEEDMTPEQDARMKNIENILAADDYDGRKGIRGIVTGNRGSIQNIQEKLATLQANLTDTDYDGRAGIQGIVTGNRKSIQNIQDLLVTRDGGGIRGAVDAIKKKLGA